MNSETQSNDTTTPLDLNACEMNAINHLTQKFEASIQSRMPSYFNICTHFSDSSDTIFHVKSMKMQGIECELKFYYDFVVNSTGCDRNGTNKNKYIQYTMLNSPECKIYVNHTYKCMININQNRYDTILICADSVKELINKIKTDVIYYKGTLKSRKDYEALFADDQLCANLAAVFK